VVGGGVPGTWGSDARHHYSKDQPWNSDGTLIALQNGGGTIRFKRVDIRRLA